MSRLLRQAPSLARQKDRAIGLAGHEPFSLQPFEGAVCGDVRDAESPRQVGQSRLSGLVNQLGDHLDVVLRQFLRVIPPSAGGVTSHSNAERLRSQGCHGPYYTRKPRD